MSAEQKLDRFKESILRELSSQEESMKLRMEEERKSAFAKAEDEVLAQCYTYIKAETARLQTQAHRSISDRTLEIKKEVLRKRTALCDGLFKDLEEKVRQFMGTDDYGQYLQSKFDEIKKVIPDEKKIELYVRPEDRERLTLTENITVYEKHFPLGGFELIARGESKFFDARLDTKLKQLRQEFINTFDITV